MIPPTGNLKLTKYRRLSNHRVEFLVRCIGCRSKQAWEKEEDIQDKVPTELYNYYDIRGGRDRVIFGEDASSARYHVYLVFKSKYKGHCVVQWVGYRNHRSQVTIESIQRLRKIAPDKLRTHLMKIKQTPNMRPWGTATRSRC